MPFLLPIRAGDRWAPAGRPLDGSVHFNQTIDYLVFDAQMSGKWEQKDSFPKWDAISRNVLVVAKNVLVFLCCVGLSL